LIILYNANIYTKTLEFSSASALAILGERIISLGSDKHILSLYGKHANAIDLHGMTVWPGLTDAHLHLVNLSRSLKSIDCETPTLQACLDKVAEKARTLPPGEWIEGHGWNQNIWKDYVYGTATQLDHVSEGHPVFLTAKSLHAAWVNTIALNLAGINAQSPDPPGGHIQRNTAGMPTGILLESAIALVSNILPTSKPENLAQDLRDLQPYFWRMGITGVHDFDGADSLNALQILNQNGHLQLRVRKNLPAKLLPQAIDLGLRSGFGDDMLHLGSLKLFADGALGPQSAALLAPYQGSDSLGTLLSSKADILKIGIPAVENGWSLTIHAIGDLANQTVLDTLADIRAHEEKHQIAQLPHRIEHVQLLDPADQERLAALNVTASVQPLHATSDMHIVDRYWGDRAANAYAFQSLLNCNTLLVFGSDAPVESPNPFWGLHAAVTRRQQDGTPCIDGWHPEQRIALTDALNAYTCNPATLAGFEDRLGLISPGFYADLIILPIDPFTLLPQDLFSILPEMTIVNGKLVYQK